MSAEVTWCAWRSDGSRVVLSLDSEALMIAMKVIDPNAPSPAIYELSVDEARRYVRRLRRLRDPEADSLAVVIEVQLLRIKELPRCA